MNEFQFVIDLLNRANDLSDGAGKREALRMACQALLDEYIGYDHQAGISRKHSIESVLEIFNTGGIND